MTRIAAALVMALALAMALVCDTIPDQDGCVTDMECETAWDDGGNFGAEAAK